MYNCELHPLHAKLDLIKSNIEEHYKEACKKDYYKPVDFDWDYYMALSKLGQCFIVTVNKENIPIGYSMFTVGNDPMRKSVIEATNTCLYVKKAFRGFATLDLLNATTKFMKDLGATEINYLIKNQALAKILKRIGYSVGDQLWSYNV